MTLPGVARDEATGKFFDGTSSGVYLIRICVPHGHASKPQAEVCSTCASQDLGWEPASGVAKLVSWVVIPGKALDPDGPGPQPTVVAIGELEEGPWMWARLLGADPELLHDGMPLTIAFERPPGSEAIPVLMPISG